MHLLFAASARKNWPDDIDLLITASYLIVILGIPLLGYVVMFLDFRRYLRSLRRALVIATNVMTAPAIPYWALLERPACLRALDLKMPCTEAEVLAAYREKAKTLHPDRGGDLQKFLRLQKNFDKALSLVRGDDTSPVQVS
ncbi:hypothetical protein Pla144_29490 [Bythopirellula polymerisocia]|uniref:J domain-containing protein n=2 Tax=Bythopirellula polymerisocia TaxID=2528003 RepID=A0A5C6CQ45_9BACT|nr:hypothetical protein Pla144_29490 [Bythopirellula polymerisocia]